MRRARAPPPVQKLLRTKSVQYVICSDRTLEIHASKKTFLKRERPRTILDLAKVFSITVREHERLPRCLCLLTPDQTFFFRAADPEATRLWLSIFFNAVQTSRIFVAGKSVPRDQLPGECAAPARPFPPPAEHAWDVKVPERPKNGRDSYPNCLNLASTEEALLGKKRLCLYREALVLVELGQEPVDLHKRLDPEQQYVKCKEFFAFPVSVLPFRGSRSRPGQSPRVHPDRVGALQRSQIMCYGARGKQFVFCTAPVATKGVEVVIDCDAESTAVEIKDRLQEIIRRETSILFNKRPP